MTNKSADIESTYWVYILYCENSSYYTGYTANLLRRYQQHLTGKAKCKYTRSFKPITIAQCWRIMGDKSLAMKIENSIKRLSRSAKLQLIQFPNAILTHPLIYVENNDFIKKIIQQTTKL